MGLSTEREKKDFCMHCLQCFSTEGILTKHKSNFIVINREQAIRMRKEGSIVQFQNYRKQMPAPFSIYADFEAITEKVSGCQPKVLNLIPISIKSTLAAVMVTKLCAAMMIHIQNQ